MPLHSSITRLWRSPLVQVNLTFFQAANLHGITKTPQHGRVINMVYSLKQLKQFHSHQTSFPKRFVFPVLLHTPQMCC